MSTDTVSRLSDMLEEGLMRLKNSDDFKKYLTCMSRFHNYSYNNTLLIMMQMPKATYVAGFKSWKNNFDRNVKKGEKGIRIFAPAPVKKTLEVNKYDEEGNVTKELKQITVPMFKPVTVFDVTQTEGKPIPELIKGELTNNVCRYEDIIDAIKSQTDIPIIEKSIEGGVKGYFDPNDQTIYINSGMSQSQTVKTMIHELAHSILHNKNIQTDEKKDRNKREIEAESVAFIVCKHFNIDTDDYSFGYILGWSKDSSLDEFRDSLETIQKCADKIIVNMQARLLKLEWEKKSLKSRLDEGRKRLALLGKNIQKEKIHERNHTFQH